MTLADEKAKHTSERYSLVRLTPARYVNDDFLDASVYPIYQFSVSVPVSAVVYSDETLTEVASVDAIANNDEWYYDADEEILYVQLDSFESAMVVYYDLYYASRQDRIHYATPTDSSTDKVLWAGRLQDEPSVTQSFRDILDGVFSVSSSDIVLADHDRDFVQYLTANDSFYNKEAVIWLVVNGVIERVYTGKISGINLRHNAVHVDMFDTFAALNQEASFGDTTNNLFFKQASRTIDASKEGRPIPMIMGRSVTKHFTVYSAAFGSTGTEQIDYQVCSQAVCTSFSNTISTTTNRTWGLCRAPSTGFKTLSFGTVSSATLYAQGTRSYVYPDLTPWDALSITTSAHNLEVGDSFTWTHASVDAGGTNYALVTGVTATEIQAVSHTGTAAYVAGANVNITAATFNPNQAPAISWYNADTGKVWFPLYELDFTYSISTLTSGNKYMQITFVSNFTNNYPWSGGAYARPIDPARDVVAFRATAASDAALHGTALQSLLEAAGLTVTASTVTAANADFAGKVSFTIPNVGESTYGNYLKYAQQILTSTMGYISADAEGEVGYHLLTGTSSSDTRDDKTFLKGSLECSVDYLDITPVLRPSNKHLLTNYTLTAPVQTSARSLALHGPNGSREFEHVLEDVTVTCASTGNDRIEDIAAVRAERRATYRFHDATESIDSILGDDITVEDAVALGGSGSVAAKITHLTKSAGRIIVQAIDLLGL